MTARNSSATVPMQRDRLTAFVMAGAVLLIILAAVWFGVTRNDYIRAFGTPVSQVPPPVSAKASPAYAAALAEARAAWGQYGDYMGGVLNPMLAFLSFAALAITLILQTKQVQLARVELAEARQAQAEAAETLTQQLAAARQLAAAQSEAADALAAAATSQERSAQTQLRQLEQAAESARSQESFSQRQVELANAAALAQQRTADAQEEAAVALSHQAEVASALAQLNAAVAMSHMYDQAISELKARFAPGALSSEAESHHAMLQKKSDEARNTAQQCRVDIEQLRKAAPINFRRV